MPISPIAAHIEETLRGRIEALSAPLVVRDWRFAIGAPEGSQAPDYDDSGWQTVSLSYAWSSLDGEAWFRAGLTLPAEIEGVALSGVLELEIFLALGATVYVNGVEKYREPSWSDTRSVRLPLAEVYHPGERLDLTVRCHAGDGFGFFLSSILHVGSLDQAIFDLDTIRGQMAFTHFLAEQPTGVDQAAARTAWDAAAAALNLDALAANHWAAWGQSVEAARASLAPFAEPAKNYTADLIAHSHIDMNWLWPMAETVEVCRRDFTAMDHLMAAYGEFYFSQSQAATYREMETHYPALFEAIRRRVAGGQWEITASTWVEGDLNMAAGESIARHLLHTRRYIGDRFGVEPLICWEPDTFGHIGTMPQILKLAGVRYYYFCRAGKRHPLFWWEGIDGSRVLAVQDLSGYGGNVTASELATAVINFATPYNIHRGMYVYGVGDHGGATTARDIEAARVIDATPYLPHAKPSPAVAFYEKAQAEQPTLPTVRGELNTVFEGCYSTHGDIKRLNRTCENALLSAETAAALATVLAAAPMESLAEAWRTLCFHQFHDILCGAAIGVTYREAHERMDEALAAASQTADAGLDALAAALDTGAGHGIRLVVFNSLACERTDVVSVPAARFGDHIPAALIDTAGHRVPVQVSGDHLFFVAVDVPALGAAVYRPSADAMDADATTAAQACGVRAGEKEATLDNGVLKLRVHPASGAVDQLVDHAAQRDVAGPWLGWGPEAKVNAGMLNRLQIAWEQPHPMSAWNIGDLTRVENLITGAEVKVIESGPVRGAIEVRRHFLHSTFTQRVVLYRGLRRVDFETEVDWHERGNAHDDAPMLRATFTPYFGSTVAAYEIPFGAIERPEDGREVPALRWADLSERDSGNYGLSLLNNGKYGHQAQGNTLGLTLVRASYEPDNNPDEGLHRFTYSLYPHAGGWATAGTDHRGAELNQPLLTVFTNGHAGPLQPAAAWLTCEPANVYVSAVKLAEDQPEQGQAVIIRLYEAHGQPAEAVLQPGWTITRAEEVDLIERPLAQLSTVDGALHLSLRPFEIKTIKAYTA
jgi:alpha-mannosidase